MVAGYVRGLSTRDVEAALGEALGPQATVSKSTGPRICEASNVEFEAFCHRDLSGVELCYLYLDGSHFEMPRSVDSTSRCATTSTADLTTLR